MGWGSIADKLNRALGGYKSEEKEVPKPEAKVEPVAEAPPVVEPPKPNGKPEPKTADPKPADLKPADDPKKRAPPPSTSIYDAPAITRNGAPAGSTSAKAPKPRKARKPKQVAAPKQETESKEQVAPVAT